MATTKATELSQLSSALQVDESTGEIIFTGSLSVDSNTLFVDGDANRVGIGTLTPGSALDVSGDVTVSGTVDGRNVSSDGSKLDTIESGADVTDTANVTSAGALMDSELTNESAIKNIDQELTATSSVDFGGLDVDSGTLFVDSANNRVGVGTSSPTTLFNVTGGISNDQYAELSSSGFRALRLGSFANNGNDNAGHDINASSSLGAVTLSTGSNTRFKADSNGDISFYEDTGTTPKFFWDASAERLGIGTSSPDAALHVNSTEDYKTIVLSEGGSGVSRTAIGWEQNGSFKRILRTFDDGTTSNLRIGEGVSGNTEYYSDDGHIFIINNSEAARIDSDGNLLVGKTALGVADEGFEVRPSGILAVNRSNASPAFFGRLNSDGNLVEFRKDGATVGSIGVDSNGLIQDGNRTDFPSFTKSDRKHFFISDIRHFNEETSSSRDYGICLVCPKFLDDFFSVAGFLGSTASSRMSAVINVRSDYQNMRANRDLVYFGIDATFLPGFNDNGSGKVNPEIIISRYHFKGDTNDFINGLVEVDYNGIPWLGIEEGVRGASLANTDEGFWIVRYDISTAIDDAANPDAILSDIRSDFLVHRDQLSKTNIKNVGDVNITDNTGAF